MTAVLVSRFLLDLQAANQQSAQNNDLATQSDPRFNVAASGVFSFARVVGSLASTLEYGAAATERRPSISCANSPESGFPLDGDGDRSTAIGRRRIEGE